MCRGSRIFALLQGLRVEGEGDSCPDVNTTMTGGPTQWRTGETTGPSKRGDEEGMDGGNGCFVCTVVSPGRFV